MREASNEEKIQLLKEKLGGCERVAVLTGAGISAESGVPTFRGRGDSGANIARLSWQPLRRLRKIPGSYGNSITGAGKCSRPFIPIPVIKRWPPWKSISLISL